MSDVPLQEVIRVAVRIAAGRQESAPEIKRDLTERAVVEKSLAALVASTALLLRTARLLNDKEFEDHLSVAFEGMLASCVYLQSRVGSYEDTVDGTREALALLADFGARAPKVARAMASFVGSSKPTKLG
jgi:hypothetical protein